MTSDAITHVTLPRPREMFCLECKRLFQRFDLDKPQPKEAGVFLSCEGHR